VKKKRKKRAHKKDVVRMRTDHDRGMRTLSKRGGGGECTFPKTIHKGKKYRVERGGN